MYQPHRLILWLVGWDIITWPLGWSDPSIGCTWYIFFLPCLLYICFDVCLLNFLFSLIYFSLGCLGLCWTISADMSSFQATKASSLVQPSFIVPLEMCSYAVLGYMSILLTIVTNLPCIVIPIIVMLIVVPSYMLIWCPHRLWSALKGSMSILLAIKAMSIKSFCLCDFRSTILCHMSLHVALVTVTLAFGCVWLIDPSTNISRMPLFITIMTTGFSILTFVTPFLSTLWWFTNFRAGVSNSWCIMGWSWGFQ